MRVAGVVGGVVAAAVVVVVAVPRLEYLTMFCLDSDCVLDLRGLFKRAAYSLLA